MSPVLTLASSVSAELVDRRSRFLAQLHPVATVAEADSLIRSARAAHPGARHTCTALILMADGTGAPVQRSQDDGEPGGTAGMPMLQALLSAQLTDTLAIVTRYFGGIKLGTGGLQRAYGGAVEQSLESAEFLQRTTRLDASLEVSHAQAGAAENVVRQFVAAHGGEVLPAHYGELAVRLPLLLPPGLLDALQAEVSSWSSGTVTVTAHGSRTVDVPR